MDIHIQRDIQAPADAVWELLGRRFGAIDSWHTTVERSWTLDSEADAPRRDPSVVVDPEAPVAGRVTVTGAGEITELLTAYSDAERRFTFRALGMPPIITFAQNSTRVTELGPGRSRAESDIHIELWGPLKLLSPLLLPRLTRKMGLVLEEAKQVIETGELPASKRN